VQAFDKAEDNQRQVDHIQELRKQILEIKDDIHEEFGE
jgi:uncharacterized protein YdcH (DUF465 family)